VRLGGNPEDIFLLANYVFHQLFAGGVAVVPASTGTQYEDCWLCEHCASQITSLVLSWVSRLNEEAYWKRQAVGYSEFFAMSEPAYHIPLTDDQLKMIGEICAIQSLIEDHMFGCVRRLLSVSLDYASKLLGSTAVNTNVEIWINAIREKCQHPALVSLAEEIRVGIINLAKGRNDFVHGLFGTLEQGNVYIYAYGQSIPTGPVVAQRPKNKDKLTPVEDIEKVRNEAARLSRMIAHLTLCIDRDNPNFKTPWLGKF
jgi:hypothetical protein